ncbi:hypothetical protein RFI_12911 [Reticulomyxa filosa]|uniref:SPRY domain-containing protein n=1 Tax=Reticulomyxa filosa TaxID=46433 RepID=X6NEQ2_RETFI|nr:hypothetical protein RFI_12911 [Reticulomyxa filosa]|eukprot:ETO24244.1 hypothetical protein RFI_12911 [Reticulomyxa filosa]
MALVTEATFQEIDEEESKETKKNPFYDVYAVIANWQKTDKYGKVRLLIELIQIIGMYRGYQSPWSNKYHGVHLTLPFDNPFCAQTTNIGGHKWEGNNEFLILLSVTNVYTYVYVCIIGNSIRGRYPLPNTGVARFSVKIWFPLTDWRKNLQMGYFVGVIRSSQPRKKALVKNSEEVSESVSSENLANYNISLVAKNRQKNRLQQIYGVEIRREKVYFLYNHFSDTNNQWNEAAIVSAGDAITVDVDIGQRQITFFKNGIRLSTRPESSPFDMKFATKEMVEEEARCYYWYPIVSLWHTDVQCDLFYD